MDEHLENNILSKDKLANLLYNEYQYRHALLWSVTKFYIILIASLYAYPLFSINNSDMQKLGFRLLIFPILAILITFIGWWHIRSESDRFKVVSDKYNEIRGIGNRPKWLYIGKRNLIEQLISEDMNKLFLSLYFILSLIFFLFGTLIIVDYCLFKNTIHLNKYFTISSIPIFFILRFFIKNNNKKREYNKKNKNLVSVKTIASIVE
jgi:hypothetical protein